MAALSVLSVAAASGRVGYVYLVDGRLRDWRISGKAAGSPGNAARLAQAWIDRLRPEVVVTEKVEEAAKKGEKTKAEDHYQEVLGVDYEYRDTLKRLEDLQSE